MTCSKSSRTSKWPGLPGGSVQPRHKLHSSQSFAASFWALVINQSTSRWWTQCLFRNGKFRGQCVTFSKDDGVGSRVRLDGATTAFGNNSRVNIGWGGWQYHAGGFSSISTQSSSPSKYGYLSTSFIPYVQISLEIIEQKFRKHVKNIYQYGDPRPKVFFFFFLFSHVHLALCQRWSSKITFRTV